MTGAAQTDTDAYADARTQELSCANVVVMLTYLERDYQADRIAAAVEPLGLPMSFLRDKKNWVSYDYYNRFLERVVALTGDERAPFKAPLYGRPQDVFEYVVYATQGVLWYGLMSIPYRLILGSNLYKRWTKIGEFEVLSSSFRSMRVRLTLNRRYRQTRYNCYAVQGMLACIPTAVGLPAADVEEIQCAADGHQSCEYMLRWKNTRGRFAGVGVLALAAVVVLELTVFGSFFTARDAVITVLAASTIGLLVKSFQYWRHLRRQEQVSIQRNQYLVKNLEQTERAYRELEETKTRLLERNEFLSIVSSVSELVTQEANFISLISKVLPLLIERLKFDQGDFFRCNVEAGSCRSVSDPRITVPPGELERMGGEGYHVVLESLDRSEYPGLFKWLGPEHPLQGSVYVVPVVVPDSFTGYFCFHTESVPAISPDLVASLFANVADQLKIGYAKIASRSTIVSILTSIPEYVLIFGINSFRVRYANKRFLQSYPGLQESGGRAVVGAPLCSVLDVDVQTAAVIEQQVKTLSGDERSETFETTVGSAVLEYSVFAIPSGADGEQLAGIILSDMTDQKSFHQRMLVSEKLLALGRVAGGIAHEINNPLYAVLSNAEEIAEREGVDEDTRREAEEIIDHVDTISAVVRDLSTYSKTMRKESVDAVDLNDVIEESLKLVRYGSNFLEIEVNKWLEPLPAIKVVRGEIQQVLINLLNNAVWAMNGRGILGIFSELRDSSIVVTVSDTGVGIPPENLQKIFHYLFTTKKAGEGTGQGLSIVDRLTRRNNGRVEVESELGIGTTFRLFFPVPEGADAEDNSGANPPGADAE